MAIRGWVYIMINKSMPGLVKIGFSTKDPTLRAGNLATGAPNKYEVAYDVLVYDPQTVEQHVHKELSHKREGKEWFRCDVSEAVRHIRSVINKDKESLAEKLYVSLTAADNIDTYGSWTAEDRAFRQNRR